MRKNKIIAIVSLLFLLALLGLYLEGSLPVYVLREARLREIKTVLEEVEQSRKVEELSSMIEVAGELPEGLLSERAPELPDAFRRLGNHYAENEEFDKAATAYRVALRLCPEEGPSRVLLLHNLGYSLIRSGKPEGERYLRRAIELEPGHSPSYRVLFVSMIENRQFDKAAAWLQAEKEQGGGLVLSEAATLLIGLKKLPEAYELLSRMVRANPLDARARYYLALVLLLSEQKTEAEVHIQKLEQLDKDSARRLRGVAEGANMDAILKDTP